MKYLRSKEQVLTTKGTLTTPFPDIKKITSKTEQKIDSWLYENAKLVISNDYEEQLLKAMSPKKLTPADRNLLNSMLFNTQQI